MEAWKRIRLIISFGKPMLCAFGAAAVSCEAMAITLDLRLIAGDQAACVCGRQIKRLTDVDGIMFVRLLNIVVHVLLADIVETNEVE